MYTMLYLAVSVTGNWRDTHTHTHLHVPVATKNRTPAK